MRFYISGGISGLPDLNRAAFAAETARLRALGHTVINPHEIWQPEPNDWSVCMRHDIAQLVLCHSISMLPGWRESRGATLEHYIAVALGMTVIEYEQVTA